MKKKVLCLIFGILLLGIFQSNSQGYGFFGYGFGFTKLTDLNYIVGRYNNTRNFLDKEMKEFNNLDGLTFNFGYLFYGIDMGMGMTFRGKKHHSTGFVNGQEFRRDLKVTNNSFYVNIGGGGNTGDYAIFGGLITEFGNFKVKTRSAEIDDVRKEDWIKPVEDIYCGAGLYLRFLFGNPGIAIEPYIVWPLFSYDVGPVNKTINPNTYQNDQSDLSVYTRVIGLKISFGIVGD